MLGREMFTEKKDLNNFLFCRENQVLNLGQALQHMTLKSEGNISFLKNKCPIIGRLINSVNQIVP